MLMFFRGEQQATAIEANLNKLESKLEAMLAQFEASTASSAAAEKGEGSDDITKSKKAA